MKMQNHNQSREQGLEGDRKAETEAQLLQNLLTEGVDKDSDEIDDYMATSFLDDQELAVLRDQQELLSRLRRIGQLMQIDKESWNKAVSKTEIVNRMQTIAQTAKSKGGVGFKAVRTEKIVQEKDLYETQSIDQDENQLMQRVMEAVKGSGGGSPVVGSPNLGQNYGQDPGKW